MAATTACVPHAYHGVSRVEAGLFLCDHRSVVPGKRVGELQLEKRGRIDSQQVKCARWGSGWCSGRLRGTMECADLGLPVEIANVACGTFARHHVEALRTAQGFNPAHERT
eukprot:1143662-Prymnesium_polylepis.2